MSIFEKLKVSLSFQGFARLLRHESGPFGYLAVLLLVVMAVSGTITTVQFQRALRGFSQSVAQAPDFGLEHGEFHFAGPMPFRIDDGDAVIVADTTGKTEPSTLNGHRSGSLLVTRDQVYRLMPNGAITSTPLHNIPFTVTKQSVLSLLGIRPWYVPVGYLLLWLLQIGFKALDAVVLGAFGLMYASMIGRRLDFGQAFKAGAYALTYPILIQWLIRYYSSTSLWFFLFWGLGIACTCVGLSGYLRQEAAIAPPL